MLTCADVTCDADQLLRRICPLLSQIIPCTLRECGASDYWIVASCFPKAGVLLNIVGVSVGCCLRILRVFSTLFYEVVLPANKCGANLS